MNTLILIQGRFLHNILLVRQSSELLHHSFWVANVLTLLCQAHCALLQLFPSLHWEIKDHGLPLPLLLHDDIQSTLGRSNAMRGRFDHILTVRAISSTVPWWPLSTEREPSWLRLVHSLLLFLQFSESSKSILCI